MKSRLALTLVLVAGFMLSTTGATLAISGSSGSGSASSSQYTPSGTKEHHPANHVQGAHTKGGCAENGGNGGNAGNGGANCNNTEPAAAVEVAPAAEQQAVVSSGSSLPFTGFVAIPLLVIGLGLIVVGAVLRLKSRNDQVA